MACKANFAGSVSVIMPDWMRPPAFSGNLFALLYLSLLAEMPIGVWYGGVSRLPVRGSCVYLAFPGRPDRRPLWAKGPYSQHRTRFDAAGKKTALIDTDSATLREAYEQLRSHVLTALPGGGRFGLAVLLWEGVAAWIEHCAANPLPA